jgi:organic hydroperoxide reductase OsmC/OhrA
MLLAKLPHASGRWLVSGSWLLVSGFWLPQSSPAPEQGEKMVRNMSRTHHYHTTTTWTGNLGSGTSQYKAYSRDHEITAAKKAAPIQGSSDQLFRGDPSRYSPEDLLVASLSACHMLWVLHLCTDAGIVVTHYSDEASGEMVEHPDGSGEFTLVTLHPRMTITDASRINDALAVHHKANEVCFVARSVNFQVVHEPKVAVSQEPKN